MSSRSSSNRMEGIVPLLMRAIKSRKGKAKYRRLADELSGEIHPSPWPAAGGDRSWHGGDGFEEHRGGGPHGSSSSRHRRTGSMVRDRSPEGAAGLRSSTTLPRNFYGTTERFR